MKIKMQKQSFSDTDKSIKLDYKTANSAVGLISHQKKKRKRKERTDIFFCKKNYINICICIMHALYSLHTYIYKQPDHIDFEARNQTLASLLELKTYISLKHLCMNSIINFMKVSVRIVYSFSRPNSYAIFRRQSSIKA